MIKNISIENFKSIKNLNFEAHRVNIFIGEPNTGKSNILEALGLFTKTFFDEPENFIRFNNWIDIFNENDISKIVNISFDAEQIKLLIDNKSIHLEEYIHQKRIVEKIRGDRGKNITMLSETKKVFIESKFYKFNSNKIKEDLVDSENYFFDKIDNYHYLMPPFGKNLFEVLLKNRNLREIVSEIISVKGYRLNLTLNNREISVIQEEKDNLVISYPFYNLSDTLQRVIFYLAAILSNKNSALIFEEPESHIFPFYNQYLAETIGLDEESGNQYFIATHNPYFLGSIAQKTKIEDLAVFITYMDNHETKLRQLKEDEYSELFDFDIFYNLDRFIEA